MTQTTLADLVPSSESSGSLTSSYSLVLRVHKKIAAAPTKDPLVGSSSRHLRSPNPKTLGTKLQQLVAGGNCGIMAFSFPTNRLQPKDYHTVSP